MESIQRALIVILTLSCLANIAGQSACAEEFHYTVTPTAGDVIIIESPLAAFSVTLSSSANNIAYSHHAYTHIAAIASPAFASQSIELTVLTAEDQVIDAGTGISVYTLPNSAQWEWLHLVSQQPSQALSSDQLSAMLGEISDSETVCLARAVLARLYLTQSLPDKAQLLLSEPEQGYPCWQLAALAMQHYFDSYHFAQASTAGMALLPKSFSSAFLYAESIVQPADWQAETQDNAINSSAAYINHQGRDTYLSTELLLTLGFSNVLHGSVTTSHTLMEAGKYSLEMALKVAIDNDFAELLPDIYNGLATYWSLANDNIAAARYLEQAISKKQQVNNGQGGIAELMNNLALVYLWAGQWELAQQTLREANQLLTEEDSAITATVLAANLAPSYSYLGDIQTAERYYQRALALSEGSVKDDDTTYIYIALANIAIAKKDMPAAINALHQAEQKAQVLRAAILPLIYALQAQAFAFNHQFGLARTAQNKAQNTLQTLVKTDQRVNALLALTRAQITLGDTSEAAKNIAELEALIEPNHPQLIPLAELKYQFLSLTEPSNDTALTQTFTQANQQVKQLGKELDAYQMGPYWYNKVRALYNARIKTLISSPTPEHQAQILNLLEDYQSQLFLRKRADRERYHLLLQPQLESLWQQRIALESAVVNSSDDAEKHSLLQQLDTVKEQWFSQVNPQRSAPKDNATSGTVLNIQTIQAELRPEQALLRYIQTDEQCFVIAITLQQDQLKAIKCPPKLQPGLSGAEITHAYRAYKASDFIPGDLIKNDTITDILFQADGRFYSLPLPQLRLPDNTYVGERFTLRQTPALSTYFKNSETQAHRLFTVAIFDAPAFEVGTSPTHNGWRDKIPDLPWAKREGEHLMSLLAGRNVTRFTGESASQQALLSAELRQASLLHIATHSYFDANEPDIVGLAVSKGSSGSSEASGFLPQHAILSKPFYNQLVVLSGCETSLGKMMAHDGLQSLAYGILTAGADSVISTRWKVSDKPTAAFMGYFYEHLFQHGNSVNALRYARQTMQHHPRFKHPKHWAGFTLTVVHQQAENVILD